MGGMRSGPARPPRDDEVELVIQAYREARAAFAQARADMQAVLAQESTAYLHPPRRCVACGLVYQPASNKQKYCSSQCRVRDGARRARARAELVSPKIGG